MRQESYNELEYTEVVNALKARSDWLYSNSEYPLLFTSERSAGFAPENIVLVAGICKL